MKIRTILVVSGALALLVLPTLPLFATTATSLSSFDGKEEPTALYKKSSNSCSTDSDTNISNPSSGLFRFFLRYSSTQWTDDGGGCKGDRSRAEVKGLGTHQKVNDTFDYATTWRTSRGGSGKFWHVFQLKATNGDTGTPLVVNSIMSGANAALRYCSNGQSGFTVARAYGITINSFTSLVIRIKVSTGSSGIVQAGLNGGSLSGKTGIALYRSGATDYRPKWGSYRGVDSSSPYGNDTVEHKGVSATKR